MGATQRHVAFVAVAALSSMTACSLLSDLDSLSTTDSPEAGSTRPSEDAFAGDGNIASETDTGVGPGDGGIPTDGATATDASWPTIGCSAGQNDPSLLAYYAFDDGSGASVKDCSGHGHDGVIVGTPTWTTTGKHGGALAFNGTNTCVNLGSAADLRLGTFTLTAWANATAYVSGTGLNGQILSKAEGNPNAIGWRFATVASPNLFEAKLAVNGGGPFTLASPGGQATGAWIHVALVLAPNKRGDIYVNTTRVASNATPPAIYEEIAASMRIGCNGGAKDYFAGQLDELRIYTRELSDAEIAAVAR